jgi:ribose-phosphate pyrophosphokinase
MSDSPAELDPFLVVPPRGDLAILSGSANPGLTRAIAEVLGVSLLPCEALVFSEGNVFVRILENVRGKDAFIVQGVHYPVNDNFVELLFWIDALKRASAANVTAVVPFFGYAKGDKKDEPRVSIRARVCADAIEAAGADRVLTMDLHSPQIQGFFGIPVDHLYARHVLCDHVRRLRIPDLVVCSPDAGFAKDAADFANLLKAPMAIGYKQRTDHTETVDVLEVVGDVRGRNVLIVDDFAISGRSLISMAELLKSRGARAVHAAVTHAVLPGEAVERIESSIIETLFVTDTIESPQRAVYGSKITPVTVAPLFAAAIRSIHDRTSVSQLFPGTRG